MKKVLVAVVMIMGLGTSVAFAQEPADSTVVTQAQAPQDEFTKVDIKDLPQVIVNGLAKDYDGSTLKEAFVATKADGKVFKVIVVTKDNEEVTLLLNEKGEPVKE